MGRFDFFDTRYDMPSDDELVQVDMLLSARAQNAPSAFAAASASVQPSVDQTDATATPPLQEDDVATEEELPIFEMISKPQVTLPRLPAVKVTAYKPRKQNTPCPVCLEDSIPLSELVNVPGCQHSICKPCLQNYLTFIATSTIKFPVPCPGSCCTSFVDTNLCLRILRELPDSRPHELLEHRSIERTFFTRMAFCSNKQCGTPMDIDMSACPEEKLEDYNACFKCPQCRRKTCVNCQTTWHRRRTCAQHRNEDGAGELWYLARSRNWTTCPSCRTFVERTEGCNHMSCVCGCEFCYDCGGSLDSWESGNGCRCYDDSPGPTHRRLHWNDPMRMFLEIADREERRTEWFERAESGDAPEVEEDDERQWKKEFDEMQTHSKEYEKREKIRLRAREKAEERAESRGDRSRRARKRATAKERRRSREVKTWMGA